MISELTLNQEEGDFCLVVGFDVVELEVHHLVWKRGLRLLCEV